MVQGWARGALMNSGWEMEFLKNGLCLCKVLDSRGQQASRGTGARWSVLSGLRALSSKLPWHYFSVMELVFDASCVTCPTGIYVKSLTTVAMAIPESI